MVEAGKVTLYTTYSPEHTHCYSFILLGYLYVMNSNENTRGECLRYTAWLDQSIWFQHSDTELKPTQVETIWNQNLFILQYQCTQRHQSEQSSFSRMATWLRQQRHILERSLPLLCSAQRAFGTIAAGPSRLHDSYFSITSQEEDRIDVRGWIDGMKNARMFSSLSPSGGLTAERVEQQRVEDPGNSSNIDLNVPVLEFETGVASSETCQLDGDIFHVPVRVDILHRVVRWQLARRQQGTHKTKTRSEVRGGGRKPWQQKGSGRARQGTIRAVQWRGGGVVHGPVVRSHEHSLQKRVRRLGLKCAVSAKMQEGRLLVVDTLEPADCKTSYVQERVDSLLGDAPRRSALFVDAEDISDNLFMGTRNLPWVDVIPVRGLNVYSILQRDYLIMSQDAVIAFEERMRRPIRPCSTTP